MLIDAILDWEWKQQLARRLFKENNVIHVTELVQCRKKAEFFDKFKEVFTINPPILVGRFVHLGLQEWLKKEYDAECEIEFRKELGNCIVVGQVDAIVRDWIVEIKYAQDVYDNKPYEHHILQVKLYLWLTNFEKGKLIYITPKKLLEFDVTEKPTDDEVLMLYDTWKSPMWDWECSYCPFNQICPNAIEKRRTRREMKTFRIKPDDVIEVSVIRRGNEYRITVTINKLIISDTTTPYFTSIKHYLFGVTLVGDEQ